VVGGRTAEPHGTLYVSPWCSLSLPGLQFLALLLWCGAFRWLKVEICSTMDLHGLQGDSLPHHGLFHGLKVISALVPEAPPPPPPPSPLTLMSAELFLSRSLTPLFQLLFHSRFFP